MVSLKHTEILKPTEYEKAPEHDDAILEYWSYLITSNLFLGQILQTTSTYTSI